MKNATCLLLTFTVGFYSIFLSGCAGSNPNPVDRYMPGDEKKSCRALYAETQGIHNEVELRNKKIKERDTWNVVFFITGFLIIVPWFLIDCKNSQETEIAAYRERENNLKVIFAEKNCSVAEMVQDAGNNK